MLCAEYPQHRVRHEVGTRYPVALNTQLPGKFGHPTEPRPSPRTLQSRRTFCFSIWCSCFEKRGVSRFSLFICREKQPGLGYVSQPQKARGSGGLSPLSFTAGSLQALGSLAVCLEWPHAMKIFLGSVVSALHLVRVPRGACAPDWHC